jgi:hypothetical protein
MRRFIMATATITFHAAPRTFRFLDRSIQSSFFTSTIFILSLSLLLLPILVGYSMIIVR